jgi:hypothetical protein
MTEHKHDETANEDIETTEKLGDVPIDDAPPEMRLKPKGNRLKHWFHDHKKIWMPVAAVVVISLGALTMTDAKYAVVNLFASTTASITVVDANTSQPISGVEVSLDGKTAPTDQKGMASFPHTGYGPHQLKVTKFAYLTQVSSQTIELMSGNKTISVKLKPTGTPVGFVITNSISGKPIKGAKLSFATSNTISAASGAATLNVPPQDTDKVKVQIQADGYIGESIDVTVASSEKTAVKLTPAGKLYFLSNRSGKIDVMKSNLDGTEATVVLAGTGKEEQNDTVLLASRDWKYLALKSRRENTGAQLYLISTANDAVSVIDHGNAAFSPIGWYNDQFVFMATRNDVQYYQTKQVALKTFSTASAKLTTIDETDAAGDQYSYTREIISTPYILENRLLYTRTWDTYYATSDKPAEIVSVHPDGTGKQVLKSFDAGSYSYVVSRPYAPDAVYYEVYGDTNRFFEFEDGAIKTASINQNEFDKQYPTFVVSPSSKLVFWQETRDGKNVIFVGNNQGKQEKQVATLQNYKAYGWYGDEYLLVSKNSSELFIMSVDGVKEEKDLVKITDYYKPQSAFDGYGYGYGAF